MHKARWIVLSVLAACGDNTPPVDPPMEPDASVPLAPTCDETNIVATLRALPGVVDVIASDCGQYVVKPARCFAIGFDQPIHHDDPAAPHLVQHLFLVHRGCDRPTIVADWGYSQNLFFDDELSVLFGANELSMEHRFQGLSIPQPWDWTGLTIKNGAADMHDIVVSFRKHYGAHFVSTGASKGGITATYHKYLYPHDLDGSVPYVAPASRSPIDSAYQQHLSINYPPCAQTLRDAQVAALSTRRGMMQQRLTTLTQPGTEGLLLESMVAHFDWGFWQRYGVGYCPQIPTATTTDDAFFQFFYQFSGFAQQQAAPATEEQYTWGALYYEWLTEQGFALQTGAHVRPYITQASVNMTMEDNFREMFPNVALPAYDGAITHAVRGWARDHAQDLLLIYGQYDPWTGGAMDQPTQASSARFFVPNATHGAQIAKLSAPDRAAAIEIASRMLGVPAKLAMIADAERIGAARHALLDAHAERATTMMMLRR